MEEAAIIIPVESHYGKHSMAKIVDIKEFHRELTDTFKTNYPHLKYCDAELGKNEEHGRFLLGPDPKH